MSLKNVASPRGEPKWSEIMSESKVGTMIGPFGTGPRRCVPAGGWGVSFFRTFLQNPADEFTTDLGSCSPYAAAF